MIVAGVASLLGAGVLAGIAMGHSTAVLAIALGLLGLGWNLGLLGGTTLVTNAAGLGDRARIQGRIVLVVALSGATGGLASGMIMDVTSYVLTFGGGLLALVMLPAALRCRCASERHRRAGPVGQPAAHSAGHLLPGKKPSQGRGGSP